MAMYDDPRDTRRRKNIVPRSRSFFPAADRLAYGTPAYNEREFQRIAGRDEMARATGRLRASGFTDSEIRDAMSGVHSTERARYGGLYPPGPGTYYNARRYAGAPLSIAIAARANLTRAWQNDLEFNRVANPQIAAAMDAQHNAVAQKANQRVGYSSGAQIGSQGYAPESPIMQNAMQGLPTLSSNAMNQVQYGVPPALSGVPSTIARPTKTPRASTPSAPGYHFGQNIRRGAWDVAAGLGNVGIYGRNLLYRPAANVFAGVFGLQPTQPMRYFDF